MIGSRFAPYLGNYHYKFGDENGRFHPFSSLEFYAHFPISVNQISTQFQV